VIAARGGCAVTMLPQMLLLLLLSFHEQAVAVVAAAGAGAALISSDHLHLTGSTCTSTRSGVSCSRSRFACSYNATLLAAVVSSLEADAEYVDNEPS
jgi:hypothetical protein